MNNSPTKGTGDLSSSWCDGKPTHPRTGHWDGRRGQAPDHDNKHANTHIHHAHAHSLSLTHIMRATKSFYQHRGRDHGSHSGHQTKLTNLHNTMPARMEGPKTYVTLIDALGPQHLCTKKREQHGQQKNKTSTGQRWN